MTFAIETPTKARLKDVCVLSQKNRQPDENPGVQLPLSMKLSNHTLSTLEGSLKGFLFTKNANGKAPTVTKRKDDKTETLDGIEPVSDLPDLSGIGARIKVLPWDDEVSGGAMQIIFATTKLDLDDCTAHSFRIKPQQGGTVQLDFVIDAPNASEHVFAKLAKYKSREVEITFEQHEAADDQQEIDVGDAPSAAAARKAGAAERAALAKAGVDAGEKVPHKAAANGNGAAISAEAAWPFPKGDKPVEAPPQSVTIERSQPGTRTARGRDKTKAALAAGAKA